MPTTSLLVGMKILFYTISNAIWSFTKRLSKPKGEASFFEQVFQMFVDYPNQGHTLTVIVANLSWLFLYQSVLEYVGCACPVKDFNILLK
jgi:hypothetical protein